MDNLTEIEKIFTNLQSLDEAYNEGLKKGIVIGVLTLPAIKLTSKLSKRLVDKAVERYFEDKELTLEQVEDSEEYELFMKNKEDE